MPITQSRILALLTESDALKRQHAGLVAELRGLLATARPDPSYSKEDLCNVVVLLLDTLPHVPWEQHAIERYHFDRHARRNERERERASHRRHAPRLTRSSSSPPGAPRPAPLSPDIMAALTRDVQELGDLALPGASGGAEASRGTKE